MHNGMSSQKYVKDTPRRDRERRGKRLKKRPRKFKKNSKIRTSMNNSMTVYEVSYKYVYPGETVA
jgi:hypothetical protein